MEFFYKKNRFISDRILGIQESGYVMQLKILSMTITVSDIKQEQNTYIKI